MDKAMTEFDRRLNRIETKHEKLARGARARMDKSGLVVMEPRSQIRLPVRAFVIVGLFVFALKALLYIRLGVEAYAARLESLAHGTFLEQVGAFLMQIDPLTQWIATQVASF